MPRRYSVNKSRSARKFRKQSSRTNIKNVKRALAEMVARKLLCEISHQCSTKTVMAALKAVKAPSSIDDILEGLQAVEDRNK